MKRTALLLALVGVVATFAVSCTSTPESRPRPSVTFSPYPSAPPDKPIYGDPIPGVRRLPPCSYYFANFPQDVYLNPTLDDLQFDKKIPSPHYSSAGCAIYGESVGGRFYKSILMLRLARPLVDRYEGVSNSEWGKKEVNSFVSDRCDKSNQQTISFSMKIEYGAQCYVTYPDRAGRQFVAVFGAGTWLGVEMFARRRNASKEDLQRYLYSSAVSVLEAAYSVALSNAKEPS